MQSDSPNKTLAGTYEWMPLNICEGWCAQYNFHKKLIVYNMVEYNVAKDHWVKINIKKFNVYWERYTQQYTLLLKMLYIYVLKHDALKNVLQTYSNVKSNHFNSPRKHVSSFVAN